MGEISSLVDEILSNAPQNFWFLKSGVEREFLILYSAPAKVPLVAGVNQCIAKRNEPLGSTKPATLKPAAGSVGTRNDDGLPAINRSGGSS
jgi:hypothetical protein